MGLGKSAEVAGHMIALQVILYNYGVFTIIIWFDIKKKNYWVKCIIYIIPLFVIDYRFFHTKIKYEFFKFIS